LPDPVEQRVEVGLFDGLERFGGGGHHRRDLGGASEDAGFGGGRHEGRGPGGHRRATRRRGRGGRAQERGSEYVEGPGAYAAGGGFGPAETAGGGQGNRP